MTDTIVTPSSPSANGAPREETEMIVLDLGTRSKRKVKRLRKGRGPLMAKVVDAMAEIARDETIPANNPVVVVVVKKRKKYRGLFR